MLTSNISCVQEENGPQSHTSVLLLSWEQILANTWGNRSRNEVLKFPFLLGYHCVLRAPYAVSSVRRGRGLLAVAIRYGNNFQRSAYGVYGWKWWLNSFGNANPRGSPGTWRSSHCSFCTLKKLLLGHCMRCCLSLCTGEADPWMMSLPALRWLSF